MFSHITLAKTETGLKLNVIKSFQKKGEKKNTELHLVNIIQDKNWPTRTIKNFLFDEISTSHQHSLSVFVVNKGRLH